MEKSRIFEILKPAVPGMWFMHHASSLGLHWKLNCNSALVRSPSLFLSFSVCVRAFCFFVGGREVDILLGLLLFSRSDVSVVVFSVEAKLFVLFRL